MGDQHTPGEYYIVTYNGRMTVKADGAISLADMYHPPSGSALANARLFAAAPDLLKALLGVLRVADRKTDEFDAARAAITKATSPALPEPTEGKLK